MQFSHYISLFIAILTLAIIPGPCVMAIVSRALVSGFKPAALMALGVAFADVIFILLAVLGLASIASMLGPTFLIVQYCSAAYLIYLGINLLKQPKQQCHRIETSNTTPDQAAAISANSSTKSKRAYFLTGFSIAMSNPKAIVFYLSFFPAFVPINQLTSVDVMGLICISILGFGGANLTYAYLASFAEQFTRSPRANLIINRISGGIMLIAGTGIALFL
ncbi:LysE family translocator [Shewanella maritima]|uniref:LysE family translocator n=1 Tax=Shewanella maritima TaxID=2520507 RepID=UPI003736A91C